MNFVLKLQMFEALPSFEHNDHFCARNSFKNKVVFNEIVFIIRQDDSMRHFGFYNLQGHRGIAYFLDEENGLQMRRARVAYHLSSRSSM